MADHSKMLAYVADCTDPPKLEQLIDNARKQGADEVAEAAFRRLISLVPHAAPGSVDHDFWTTVHAFEHVLKQERGKTIRLSRTRQMVARHGVIATLKAWAAGKRTEGFDMLRERGMLDLAGEAIVLRHPEHFEPPVLEAARARLAEAGYPP